MTAPLKIGLTGGIGSGKSTVAVLLVELGATLIDTDALSRELTAPGGAALPAIEAAFGAQAIKNGALDRAWMRQQVFADPHKRQQLESILHPMIRARTDAAYAAVQDSARGVVFDVPLLVESGTWRERVDRVWVVDCPQDVQVRRVQARSGLDEATIRAIIAQQATREQRRAVADAVIDNSRDDPDALRARVQKLWEALPLQS
ncbi:dephospho-CoA kinase [Amphibiibacter pelophylacis]|uniref:Dephospho-CoA kinase n=1 Tax=Amphibiibacter pelophylacis TaxID=1799477 RepID=A0ACC6P3U7_9BURK